MVPKCGYIRKAVAAASKDTITELDLSALPGGADAFEKAALYCYGGATGNLEITPRNAAALRCAAAFLDMESLARRVEDFLTQAGLRTLPNAVAVLRSCDFLPAAAEELGIVRRAADAVALKICNEALLFRATGRWAAELAALSPASFGRVATALRCRRAGPEVIAAAAVAYAELVLVSKDHGSTLLESVVDVLPPASDAPLPAAFLCRLLHAAVNANNVSAKTCRDLELRVAAVLDQATAGDLLGVALDGAGERVTNTDTVRRVISAFVERQQQQSCNNNSRRRASLSGGRAAEAEMEKVARTVDEVAAEMATEEALPVCKLVGVLGAVPRDARATHDWVYRAVDIYLKTHPELDEMQREKVCSVMDPLRLSYQARLHASQNKRLPLQAVLTALYYDQLSLRSSSTAAAVNDDDEQSLARENEALRSELARMRACLSAGSMQQHLSPAKKKASFLGSVSRTLSRLNPFNKGGWAKDIAHGRHGNTTTRHHVVNKPKRRRFSIS